VKSFRKSSTSGVQSGDVKMERYLQSSFSPVAPRPDFVSGLKTRLVAESKEVYSRSTVLQYVLLSLAGVLTSVLLILAGVRAVLTLLGVLGILRQMRGPVGNKQSQPLAM
jgi:hypothetical protein